MPAEMRMTDMETMTIDTVVAEIVEKFGALGLSVDQITEIAERLIAGANGFRSPGRLTQAGKPKQISSQQRAEGSAPELITPRARSASISTRARMDRAVGSFVSVSTASGTRWASVRSPT
jgi:hypothetical protein